MAKIKKRGESGAAKNYITRTQAIRKLQITLADFRRLCILKGIYPREPLNKKRANKGSTAPTSFYYHKDIQYLLHEPLLARFRDHKAFAKKLARAVGRQEWGLAKNLEEAKPVMRLDHLVKERYPTFTLALQDMQDPLNLVHLFSTLPTSPIPGKAPIPSEVINDCARLISEWKVWAIRTHSLRKMFLGIKGIYYEISVPSGGQDVPVRWLEGYEFQQHVPTDVDFRILMTFIELYRVLLGFVMFKLYTEENLVYPPPLDKELDERGESVGAFKLVQKSQVQAAAGAGVSKKEVRRAIKGIQAAGTGAAGGGGDVDMDVGEADDETAPAEVVEDTEVAEDFIERPSKDANTDVAPAGLTTFANILSSSSAAASSSNLLFAPYTFYISRETSSRTWEFVVRAMGGKCISSVQCPDLGAKEADGITHVICDRPMTAARRAEMEKGRKWVWVQPQWVADCVNSQKVLGATEYAPGELLPPHLSPWDGENEAVRPWLDQKVDGESATLAATAEDEEDEEALEEEDEDEDEDSEEETETAAPAYPPALLAAAADPTNPTLLHAAELEAETNGTSSTAFKAQLKEATKTLRAEGKVAPKKTPSAAKADASGEDLRKIMMSNKKAKLYEKMKHSNKTKQDEKEKLEAKRVAIEKRKRKEARSAGRA